MTAFKVFFACALGAFIGALVALQMSPALWWFGAGVGFMSGYLCYEFRAVLSAIRNTWKSVIGWSPNAPFWRMIGVAFISMFSLATIWTSVFFLLMLAVSGDEPVSGRLGILGFSTLVYVFTGLMFPTMATMITATNVGPSEYEFIRKRAPEFFVEAHPLTVCLKGLKELIAFGRKMPSFFGKVFRLIHSDMRLLCGVDAAIGAGIGYFAGNAFVGALAGGILGVANYYLVSVKLLKVVPEKR